MTSRKIGSFGACRVTATGESLHFLPGGADTEAPPDWSDSEGQGLSVPCPSLNTKVGSAPEGAEGSVLEVEHKMTKKPTRVRVDKFAPFQVAREFRLTPMEAYVLLSVVLLADWRSEAWVGTLSELAADLRASKTTVSRALGVLAERGLVTIAEPFTRNRPGLVVVDIYGRLAEVPPGRAHASAESRPRHEAETRSSDDQRLRDSSKELRNQGAIKEEGSESRDAVGRLRQAFPGAEEVS